MYFKFFSCAVTLLIFNLNIFAGQKTLNDYVQEYILAENNDNIYQILAFEPLGDSHGYRIRSEDEITEFLFLALEKLADDPKRPSLQYCFRLTQVLNMIFKNVDATKFRSSKPLKTNLDDRHVKILFKALRARMFLMAGSDASLAEFLEKVTQVDCGYSAQTVRGFSSEAERIRLLDLWEKKYFEAERDLPALVALPKKASAYEIFLSACQNFRIIYDGGICMDGGSIPVTITNGVRIYTVYFNQSSMGKYAKNPVSLRITSNSSNYYAGEELEFPTDDPLLLSYGYTDDRFFEAVKGRSLNCEALGRLRSIADSTKDKNIKTQINRFLDALKPCAQPL